MTVFFVGAGPGDPELLTVKAHALLSRTKCCIYAGSLVGDEILKIIPRDAKMLNSASMNLEEIEAAIVDADGRGIDVVRLHSGDPSIYGAIGEQISRLKKRGIQFEVIPGVSSFQAAAAALRVELTAPEVSQTVVLTRTAGRTPMPEMQELHHLAKSRATLCLFLSVHKIAEIADTLTPYYGADCPAAVVYHVSRWDQKIVLGVLSDIAPKTQAEKITKTALVLIGPALSQEGLFSKLYDKTFSHEYRKGIAKCSPAS
jgi:precorrin-4/cobalt-precorrin-4 C11-methyltransferase